MSETDIEYERYHAILADGGAHYAETNLTNFIVEPWNALSSLFLILPAIYWAFKIKGAVRENAFVASCVPLLLLGGLGSTFFHAFRSSPFWLLMDVLPMLILTTSLAAYFWQKLLKNWYVALGIVLVGVGMRIIVSRIDGIAVHTAINFSYFISGVSIFLPTLLICIKTKFHGVQSLVLSIVLFGLGLFFRETDAWNLPILPMGTHFLWHISTAIGAFYLAKYLYHLNKKDSEERILLEKALSEKEPLRANR